MSTGMVWYVKQKIKTVYSHTFNVNPASMPTGLVGYKAGNNPS